MTPLFSDERWQACFTSFLQSIQDRTGSVNSFKVYAACLTRFFSDVGKSPDLVTRQDVREFIAAPSTGRRNHGGAVAASTKNSRGAVLKSFYIFASNFDIDGQPLFQKALPTQSLKFCQPAKVYRAMSEQELEKFWSVIPAIDTEGVEGIRGARDRAIFTLFLLSARRRNELAALRYGSIEYTMIVDGNERRLAHVFEFYGKGHSRDKDVAELPRLAWEAIQTYLERSGRDSSITAADPLFALIGRDGSPTHRPLSGQRIYLAFKRYVAQAGLPMDRVTLHSLRHSSAALRLKAGESLDSISRTLRHSSIAVTSVYLTKLVSTGDSGAALLESRLSFLK